MTSHLSPEETVRAIEHTLEPLRAAHVEQCAECRTAVSDRREVLAWLPEAVVPEPSPLFWDHFSERVREATATPPLVAAGWSWTRPRAWLAGSIAAAAVVAAMTAQWLPRNDKPSIERGAPVAVASAADPADQWASVVEMSGRMAVDDVHALATTADGATSIEELSSAEREVFVRLVQAEMESMQ